MDEKKKKTKRLAFRPPSLIKYLVTDGAFPIYIAVIIPYFAVTGVIVKRYRLLLGVRYNCTKSALNFGSKQSARATMRLTACAIDKVLKIEFLCDPDG